MLSYKYLSAFLLFAGLFCTELTAQTFKRVAACKMPTAKKCGTVSCSQVRNYCQSVIARKQSEIRIKKRNRMPVNNPGGCKVIKTYPDKKAFPLQHGSEYLNTLRQIHALQLKIIRSGESLPVAERMKIFQNISAVKEKLEIPLRQIRNFPHKQLLDSMEQYLTKLHERDRKISREKILLHIQKHQIRSLKNYINNKPSCRQIAGK